MEDNNLPQPKEVVSTVAARCAHCGTVWDIERIVEQQNEDGQLVETDRVIGPQMCPTCNPNPAAPSADAIETIDTEETVPVPEVQS